MPVYFFLFCVMGERGLPCGFPPSSCHRPEGCLAWDVPCGIILGPGNWCSWLGPNPVLGYNGLLPWGLSSGSKSTKIWKLVGPQWPRLRNHQCRSPSHMTDQSKSPDRSRFRGGKQTSSLDRKRAESLCQEALGCKRSFQQPITG